MTDRKYYFENNIYYGIFFSHRLESHVYDILSESKYSDIANKKVNKYKVKRDHLYASTNSDTGEANRCFIFVDEMTKGGPDEDFATNVYANFEPQELVKLEEKHKEAVGAITDMYEIIINGLRKSKISLRDIYHGWSAICCTWEDDDDDTADPEVSSSRGSSCSSNSDDRSSKAGQKAKKQM